MVGLRVILAVLLMLGANLAGATFAGAEAPTQSPRPQPRPQTAGLAPAPAVLVLPSVALAILPGLRPKPRPARLAAKAVVPETVEPEAVEAEAPKVKPGREKRSKKGSVCGDRAIKGEKLARIRGKVKGCGVADPVQVTSVDGVRLNPPATLDCDTAVALRKWVQKGMAPAFRGREVVELRIAAHYICRSRNNIRGNRISEHGRGKAVDISGFVFSDGKEWSVAGNYGKEIRRAHKAACGVFGTTLGPGSDGYHEDHLHFDAARHRGGPYCR